MEQNRQPRNNYMQLYGQLNYDKRGKNIKWGKDSVLNQWCWENWTAARENTKLEQFLISSILSTVFAR